MKRSNKSLVESLKLNGWKAWEEDGIVKIQYTKDVAPYINKEETMNPEKEASKYQDESMDERISRIVDEKISEAVKELEKGLYASAPFETLGVKLDGGGAEPQLTQKENNILKGLHYLGWSWIARDRDGHLIAFTDKPQKELSEWESHKGLWEYLHDMPIRIGIAEPIFNFIQWQNDRPMLIANLIDWSDEA